MRVSFPPQTIPPMDGPGFAGPWRKLFEGLWRRSGGSADVAITSAGLAVDNLTLAVTSDTNFRITYIGSDGTTRTADITLS